MLNKFVRTIMAIIGRRIWCVVRESNPAPYGAACASFGTNLLVRKSPRREYLWESGDIRVCISTHACLAQVNVSGQLEAPAAELPPGEKSPLLSMVGAWLGPSAGFEGYGRPCTE